jgi:tRNA (guanine-N(7)-)-methyltransferase subunit TRM82
MFLELQCKPSETTTTTAATASENYDLNDITAVAIIPIPSSVQSNSTTTATTAINKINVACAVARNDKTLSIYSLALEDDMLLGSATSSSSSSILPSIIYHTPKRVSGLTFANLTAAVTTTTTSSVSSSPSSSNGRNTIPVLISGDLAGDSHAYNLLEKGKRLLLGHTASMLTGIAIVNDNSNSYLVTADRDEKIRISRFPESYIIEGFLLGHSEYVTAIASSSSLLVSCGGDKTMRLWNWRNQNELCSLGTYGNDGDNDNSNDKVPVCMDMNDNEQYVAVIFDDTNRLDLYKITQTSSLDDTSSETTQQFSLELVNTLDCPSQPLSVAFEKNGKHNDDVSLFVLMRDPEYVVAYKIQKNNDQSISILAKEENYHALEAMKEFAAKEKIIMPTTILEKDQYGKPVLQKENETRGPSGGDAPWNRVERIEIAKEREKRQKKKKQKIEIEKDQASSS